MEVFEKLLLKKPYSSGIRHQVYLKNNLFSCFSLRMLQSTIKTSTGRNHDGFVVNRRNYGRGFRSFRRIDFLRTDNINVPCQIKTIHLDSLRSAFVALIYSQNGTYSYVLAWHGLGVNSVFYAYNVRPEYYLFGSSSELRFIPEGFLVHNLESMPCRGGKYLRAAGTFSVFLNRDYLKKQATLRLSSGKIFNLSFFCKASLGRVSNVFNLHKNIGSAGRNLKLGYKYVVRGVAKNPVDHAHGGGEGKKSKPVTQSSPWGLVCKFKKTSRKKIQRR